MAEGRARGAVPVIGDSASRRFRSFHPHELSYSDRRASQGLSCEARHAGTRTAVVVTSARTRKVDRKIRGSWGSTKPITIAVVSWLGNDEPTRPIARPV